jgi:hypothetical protein
MFFNDAGLYTTCALHNSILEDALAVLKRLGAMKNLIRLAAAFCHRSEANGALLHNTPPLTCRLASTLHPLRAGYSR